MNFRLHIPLALAGLAALTGCFNAKLNAAANRLREANMKQEAQIADLTQKLANRDATIKDLQARLASNSPPIQTLPTDRLAGLFTAARIEIQSTTDTYDAGDGKGVHGFRAFIRTLSDDNEVITATGNLTIEAFELPTAPAEPKRIGSWTFSPQDMKKNWYSGFGLNHYAFTCPWSSPPTSRSITFTAHYVDTLTGQTLEARLQKTITLPPSTQPQPASPTASR